MTQQSTCEFPASLASAIEPYAAGFGIARNIAPILLLQIVGAIAGDSIRCVSRNLFDCTPGFDVASIHADLAMLPGALLTPMDGAVQEIEAAVARFATMDRRDRCLKRDALQRRAAELTAAITEKETRLQELRTPNCDPPTVEQIRARMTAEPPMHEIERLVAALPQLKKEEGEVQSELADLMIALYPAIIRERTDWRQDFLAAGQHAVNGHHFQFASAASLLAETASSTNQLKHCAQLLARSRSESPVSGFDTSDNGMRACVHLHGQEEEFKALLRHSRLKHLEMLNGFVIVDLDKLESRADVDALVEFGAHEWHECIANVFRLRASGMQIRLELDRAGLGKYLVFRNWCRDFMQHLPAEHRVQFLRFPELMVRLATSMALISNTSVEGILEARFMDAAVLILKDHAPRQAAILVRLTQQRDSPARENSKVESLLQRLRRKGGQTRRDLARSYSGQSYAVIDARIFAAVSRGLVHQKDGLFYAADVNVNASTEPAGTMNEGGVAA